MSVGGEDVLLFHFRVIRLWEVDFSRPELQHPVGWALSVLEARATVERLTWAEEQIQHDKSVDEGERRDLLVVLGTLAERRWGEKLLNSTLRSLMMESPFWEKAAAEVRTKAHAEGLAEGRVGGLVEAIRAIAKARGVAWPATLDGELLRRDEAALEGLVREVAAAPSPAALSALLAPFTKH